MAKKRPLFVRDLADGKSAEQLVSDILSSAGFSSSLDSAARLQWDIVSTYKKLEFHTEVKFDAYEQRSGNIAIEVFNSRLGKPSGLTATEAFFWAQVLSNKVVWITRVTKLKDYTDAQAPLRIIDKGGDKNATLYLYPSREILPDVFTRIDNMTTEQVRKFVIGELNEYRHV